jgi:hypothetical protein
VQRNNHAARARRLFLLCTLLLAATALVGQAMAADPKVEKEAEALQKKSIDEDYLNVDFGAAIKKLQTALAKCDGDKCKPSLKGALLRDLGAMQILAGSVDEGKANFVRALGAESALELDPAYKSVTLSNLWNEARKGAATAPAPAPPTPTPAEVAPAPPVAAVAFVYSPPSEALVRAPFPIYVEAPTYPTPMPGPSLVEEITHVVAKYKGLGMTDWKTVDLKKMDKGYGGLIPCHDVIQGALRFYVQGLNEKNEVVATAGSRNKPLLVTVKPKVAGQRPSLPGQEPPVQCEDIGSECPPDFPGCKNPQKEIGDECAKDAECKSGLCSGAKCTERKEGGATCEADNECASSSCSEGKCAGRKGAGEDCEAAEDCDSGKCEQGKCASSKFGRPRLRRIWIGLSVQADWYAMAASKNVCMVPAAPNVSPNLDTPSAKPGTAGYACLDPTTNAPFPQFPPGGVTNSEIIPTGVDQVRGGFAFGNLRILASADYAINASMMAGIRGGYVLFTNPATAGSGAAFAPVHLEARFSYFFGNKPLIAQTVAPLVFAGLGIGEFDAFVPVTVDANVPMGATTVRQRATENAWLTAGPVFIAGGAGVRVMLAPPIAATVAGKVEAAFGGTAGTLVGLAPEIGLQYGF